MPTTPLVPTAKQRRRTRLLAVALVVSFAFQSSWQFSPLAVAATAESEPTDGVLKPAGEAAATAASVAETSVLTSDTGWLAPTSSSILETTVTDPANAYAQDGVDAVCSLSSAAKYGDFGLAVPSNALITGIEVKTRTRSDSSDERHFAVSVSWNNGAHWSTPVDTTNTDTNYITDVLGGPTNTWGHTWSAGQLADGQFAVRVREDFTGRDATAGLDVVAVKIHYMTVEPNPALPQACGLDLALVIDSSGSIDPDELMLMKNAYKDFVDAFLPGTPTRMSVVEYDTNVVLPTLGFTTDVTDIKNDIDAAHSGGWTNWEAGLLASHNTYDPRPAKPDLMLFASDGNPNTTGVTGDSDGGAAGETAALAAAVARANAVKADGIRILALGIGDDLNVANLKAISGPSVNAGVTSDVITSSFESLAADLAALAGDLCGGKILVQKAFDTNGDGQADLDGASPNPLLAGYTFDVDGAPSNPAAQVTSNTGSLEFSVLNGTYNVQETALPATARLVSAGCTLGQTPIGSVDLTARTVSGLALTTDQTVACTFVNQPIPEAPHFGVAVDKVAPATVAAGNQLTFTLNWSITGNVPVNNVILTDALPANTTFVSASNGGSHASGVVTWQLGTKNPGDSGSVTLTVQIASLLTNGTVVPNEATICGEGDILPAESSQFEEPREPSRLCSSDQTTTTVVSQPILGLTKIDTPDPVAAGQLIAYTVNWSVGGNSIATNVVITDPVPAATTFVLVADGGVYNAATNVVTWNLGVQAPGASGAVHFTVRAASPVANGTVVTNTASIDSAETDPAVTASATTVITSAPTLSITKTENVDAFLNPGQTVLYTIVVANAAAALDTAHAVMVTDTLPAGLAFDDGTTTKTFGPYELAPGASKTITANAVVSAKATAGTYTNTATAKGSNTNEVTATAVVEVRVPVVLSTPELTIVKTALQTVANPGSTVRYSVEVKNNGAGAADNVVVTDTLPDQFTFASDGTTKKEFAIGTLQPGQTFMLSYEVNVGKNASAGKHVNVAVVAGDNAASVQDDATVTVRTVKVLAATGAGVLDTLLALLGLVTLAAGLATILDLRRRLA